MAFLNFENLEKNYASPSEPILGLAPLTATIPLGSFTVITGKSGSGKTTLLHIITGLIREDRGSLSITKGDERLPLTQTQLRAGLVFQEPRLLPWLTAKENMAFPRLGGYDITDDTITHYIKLMGLWDVRNHYPHQLSGGQAQRVALGRALCAGSQILLMDEPFASLDYFTRKRLQEEVYQIFRKEEKTVLFVTHDIHEAALLSDQVLCLRPQGPHTLLENTVPFSERSTSAATLAMESCILQSL